MTFSELKSYVLSDLHRYNPEESGFLRLMLNVPGYRYSFLMRLAGYFKSRHDFLSVLPYVIIRFLLRRCEYKFGISIPYNTDIGHGLYIGHYGGIIINCKVIIGKNCNLNHEVTIGESFGGKNPGTPVIGDNVYIGPGAKIIGGISIGNNAYGLRRPERSNSIHRS